MSANHKHVKYSADRLIDILNRYSVGPNNSNISNVPPYLKADQLRKIVWMVGSIFESYITAKDSVDSKKSISELMRFVLIRWRVHLSSYNSNIRESDIQNDTGLCDFLESTTWTFSFDVHITPGIF